VFPREKKKEFKEQGTRSRYIIGENHDKRHATIVLLASRPRHICLRVIDDRMCSSLRDCLASKSFFNSNTLGGPWESSALAIMSVSLRDLLAGLRTVARLAEKVSRDNLGLFTGRGAPPGLERRYT